MFSNYWLGIEYPGLYTLLLGLLCLSPFLITVAISVWLMLKKQSVQPMKKSVPFYLVSISISLWLITLLNQYIKDMYRFESSLNMYEFQVDSTACNKLKTRGIKTTANTEYYCSFVGNYNPKTRYLDPVFILHDGAPTGLNQNHLEMATKRDIELVKSLWLQSNVKGEKNEL